MSILAQVQMKIIGLDDKHSEAAVSNVLRELSGVTQVKVYLNHGTVNVSYSDGRVSVDEMKEVIQGHGFKVE